MPSRERVSWAKFRVTVVSTVAALILLTLVYLLSGATVLQEKATIYVYAPDATGISIESPVEVNGIVAGQVDSVQLTGSNAPDRIVRITMEVLRDQLRTIPDDSYAQIDSESLVGDKLIAITGGVSPNAIRPGGELRFKAQADLMKSLDLTQFQTQLRSLNATLDEIDQGKSALSQFILGEQMYDDLLKRVSEIERGIHAAAQTTSDLGRFLYSDQAYTQVRESIVRTDDALARIESGQGDMGRLLRDTAQFESARNELADLRKSLASLRQSPFLSSDEAYTDWNRRLAALIRSVDEAGSGPLFNTSEAYDSLTGAAAEMRNAVQDFRQNPKKYLRIRVF